MKLQINCKDLITCWCTSIIEIDAHYTIRDIFLISYHLKYIAQECITKKTLHLLVLVNLKMRLAHVLPHNNCLTIWKIFQCVKVLNEHFEFSINCEAFN
jgi:hypothetical protein